MEEQAINILDVKGDENEALLNQPVATVPTIQVTQLPSQFKGYPQGTIISYEPLTLGELEALNTDEMEPTRAVAMLLNAIHCNTLPAEDLYYWDIMYIGIKRKLQAFGETKGTIYKRCPKCGELLSVTFKYTDIDFKEITAPNLPMKMEVCGKQLEFGELSMKDFLQIQTDDGELGVYARMIKNLPFEQAFSLVTNAYGVDIKKLRFADKQLDYGMKPFVVECHGQIVKTVNGKQQKESCNEKVYMEVRSPFEVVFPDDESDGDIGFEVQYG